MDRIEKTGDEKADNKEKEETKIENIEKEAAEKQNKQVRVFLVGMAVIIILVFIVTWMSQEAKRFEYAGLEFEKTHYGEIPFYKAKMTISSITGNIIANYNLYLRNDPRKLKGIPIDGIIRLTPKVVLAIDENLKCGDSTMAGTVLGQFFGAMGVSPTRGEIDLIKAEEMNVTYANCNLTTRDSIIIVVPGNKTEIVQENVDCYKIKVKECEILKAIERFILGIIENSR